MIYHRRLPKIHAITFDLDDTLYNNHSIIVNAEKALFAYLANKHEACKDIDYKFWRSHRSRILKHQPNLMSDMGLLRKLTLASGLRAIGYQGRELRTHVDQAFEFFYNCRSQFKLIKTIDSLLKDLSQKVPLVAITNGNVNLQQVGIDDYFTHVFMANIANPMKPHPHMFVCAQKALNLHSKHILHVGDNLEKDVWGAKKQGFSTAWYAENRIMNMNTEPALVIPDVTLDTLDELSHLI